MSKIIDIRNESNEQVTVIQFADRNGGYTKATRIHRKNSGTVAIEEEDGMASSEDVRVTSIPHARNLIKALEKAIELGWLSQEEQ
jgi:hypothetical protein